MRLAFMHTTQNIACAADFVCWRVVPLVLVRKFNMNKCL
jgi:hypothetical protein